MTYALWAGVGTALTALVGIGIILGVAVLNLFGVKH